VESGPFAICQNLENDGRANLALKTGKLGVAGVVQWQNDSFPSADYVLDFLSH